MEKLRDNRVLQIETSVAVAGSLALYESITSLEAAGAQEVPFQGVDYALGCATPTLPFVRLKNNRPSQVKVNATDPAGNPEGTALLQSGDAGSMSLKSGGALENKEVSLTIDGEAGTVKVYVDCIADATTTTSTTINTVPSTTTTIEIVPSTTTTRPAVTSTSTSTTTTRPVSSTTTTLGETTPGSTTTSLAEVKPVAQTTTTILSYQNPETTNPQSAQALREGTLARTGPETEVMLETSAVLILTGILAVIASNFRRKKQARA